MAVALPLRERCSLAPVDLACAPAGRQLLDQRKRSFENVAPELAKVAREGQELAWAAVARKAIDDFFRVKAYGRGGKERWLEAARSLRRAIGAASGSPGCLAQSVFKAMISRCERTFRIPSTWRPYLLLIGWVLGEYLGVMLIRSSRLRISDAELQSHAAWFEQAWVNRVRCAACRDI